MTLWIIKRVAIFFVATALMSADCLEQVIDNAHVLAYDQISKIAAAAQPLIDSGADVHFVTTEIGDMPNLDAVELQMESACPVWMEADGVRGSGLLVFVVAPKEHKSGIYFGSMWHEQLTGNWGVIRKNSMNPRFRVGDWAGGLIAGAGHAKAIIGRGRPFWRNKFIEKRRTLIEGWIDKFSVGIANTKSMIEHESSLSEIILKMHFIILASSILVIGVIYGTWLFLTSMRKKDEGESTPPATVERPVPETPVPERPKPAYDGGGSGDFSSIADDANKHV